MNRSIYLFLAWLMFPTWAWAQLTVLAQNPTITASPSSLVTGYLDIYVQTGPQASQLAYYYMTIHLIGPEGVSLAGIQQTNEGPHPRALLFPTREVEYAIGSTPTPTRLAVDINPTSSNVTVFDGAGLFRIVLEVAPAAYGQWTLNIDTSTVASTTFGRLNPIADVSFTAVNGTITVVPEPTSVLLLLPLAGDLLTKRRPKNL